MKKLTVTYIIKSVLYFLFSIMVLKSKALFSRFYNCIFGEKTDVCIVKIDHIGDFIIWLGVAKQLREYYKNEKITLICSSAVALLAEKSGFFDEVITCKNYSYISHKIPLIKLKAKTVLIPTYSKTLTDDFIADCIYAENKISIVTDGANLSKSWIKLYNVSYNRLIDTGLEPTPEIERNQIFFNILTGQENKPMLADLSFAVKNRMISEKYFVVNLGASNKNRMWGEEKFAEVSEKINSLLDYTCVLVGGKNEEYLAEKFLKNYSLKVVNLIGKTDLSELITVIKYAEFVLSNDTSTVHFSAALQTRCFAIVPGYFYPRFTFYSDNLFDDKQSKVMFITKYSECLGCVICNNAKYKECLKENVFKCVNDVSVEDVYQMLKRNLL